jgi:hypothetical protein
MSSMLEEFLVPSTLMKYVWNRTLFTVGASYAFNPREGTRRAFQAVEALVLGSRSWHCVDFKLVKC